MIAKIIAVGGDRAEALARLRRAVTETAVIVESGATNKNFLTALLAAREVIDATWVGVAIPHAPQLLHITFVPPAPRQT